MPDGGGDSDQLLELQRRGLELATQEAEDRRAEVEAILSSRRVLRAAEQDPSIRASRLAIVEELAAAPYPRLTVLEAARHLAVRSAGRHVTRRQRVLAGAAALALCVAGAASALAVTSSSPAPHTIIPTHALRARASGLVPKVVGMSAVQARAVLKAAGLPAQVNYTDLSLPAGIVTRQVPAAYAPAQPGTRVTIVVGLTSTPHSLSPSTTIASSSTVTARADVQAQLRAVAGAKTVSA